MSLSPFSDGIRESLRSAFDGGAWQRVTATHQTRQANGTWSAGVAVVGLVTSDDNRPSFDTDASRKDVDRVVVFRPLADESIAVGDALVIDGVRFLATDVGGTVVRRITAISRDTMGHTAQDVTRANGGG